jgi:hypothetical protein
MLNREVVEADAIGTVDSIATVNAVLTIDAALAGSTSDTGLTVTAITSSSGRVPSDERSHGTVNPFVSDFRSVNTVTTIFAVRRRVRLQVPFDDFGNKPCVGLQNFDQLCLDLLGSDGRRVFAIGTIATIGTGLSFGPRVALLAGRTFGTIDASGASLARFTALARFTFLASFARWTGSTIGASGALRPVFPTFARLALGASLATFSWVAFLAARTFGAGFAFLALRSISTSGTIRATLANRALLT